MVQLPGYTILLKIFESHHTIVYRAMDIQNQRPVILKMLKSDYPTSEELIKYSQEYKMTSALNIEGVIKVYDLIKYKNSLIIVFEDIRGETLKILNKTNPLTIAELLEIFLMITDVVGKIHQTGIMHKDLNPSNIIYNSQTKQLRIIDFGNSTNLTHEMPFMKKHELTKEIIAYISPEQTGRMNRTVDYRTDFYTLGITFYELLTGGIPFDTNDIMEMLYCHIAKMPIPPHEIDPQLPEMISNIVIKMMAKEAEQRYQSAFSLKADLKQCHDMYVTGKFDVHFKPGQLDISERFQIPEKLYGREKEIRMLRDAFVKVNQGSVQFFCIKGPIGIGKTVLANEIHRWIHEIHGFFFSAKFDSLTSDIPYAPLLHAFRDLVRQVLTEDEIQLSMWKEKMLNAFGRNGQILIDIIPELELIIGKQSKVIELPPTEALHRFHFLIQNFIALFATNDHPLVVFLDNLQWIDSSSLMLIERFMASFRQKYMFIILAYRDSDITNDHPGSLLIKRIEQSNIAFHTMTLEPLTIDAVQSLIADTLKTAADTTQYMAKLCHQVTGGNPFFLNEYLTSLYEKKIIVFDEHNVAWRWDTDKVIPEIPMSHGLTQLMLDKISKLSPTGQHILKLVSCIGEKFDLKTVSHIFGQSMFETSNALWEVLKEGFVIPMDDKYKCIQDNNDCEVWYKFQHHTIHQIAYSLLDDSAKKKIHITIGMYWLKTSSIKTNDIQDPGEHFFDVVKQLNLGRDIIRDDKQRYQLAELNLLAGKRAKLSAAFETSLHFFKVGIELLPEDCWRTNYDLSLELYLQTAETYCLCGQFDQMEFILKLILSKVKSLLDQVKVYEIFIQSYIAQNKPLDAVKTALSILRQLGLKISEKPNKMDMFSAWQRLKVLLVNRQVENLLELPKMTDPKYLVVMRIMSSIFYASFSTIPELAVLLIFKSIHLSIKHGNAAESAEAYAGYGVFLCVYDNIDMGFRFGKLALDLLKRMDIKHIRAKTYLIVNIFIQHWKTHIKETVEPVRKAYQMGLETGDYEDASTALMAFSSMSILFRDLLGLEKEMSSYCDAIEQLGQGSALSMHRIWHQLVLNMIGSDEHPHMLSGQVYDENIMLPMHLNANNKTALFMYYMVKIILTYTFGHYQEAISHSEKARGYLDSVMGSVLIPIFNQFDSLSRLAFYKPSYSLSERHRLLRQVKKNQKEMKQWAVHAPMNYRHIYYLVKAEYLRTTDNPMQAIQLYDKAINFATEHGYLIHESLGNELAAKFWIEQGKPDIATLYMKKAHYGFLHWGAMRKVRYLEELYADMIKPQEISRSTESETYSQESREDASSQLDISTILKAFQAISSEIELKNLLNKLIRIVMENAGAEKGLVILKKEQGLVVETLISANSDESVHFSPISVNMCNDLPLQIIHYVIRTQVHVVINDTDQYHMFDQDEYLEQYMPKSILCFPIMRHGVLTGLLYLENRLAAGIFTPERVKMMGFFVSQAAISIENARLYSELKQSEKKYRSLYEHAIEGYFQTNQEGLFLSVNPSMARIFGFDSISALLSTLSNLDDIGFVSQQSRDLFQKVIKEKKRIIGFETQFYKKDGSIFWGSLSLQAVVDSTSNIPSYEGSMVDITERKNREKAEREREIAEESNRQLQELDLMKSEFLSSVSHELRTPLTSVLGFTKLIRKDFIRLFMPMIEENSKMVNKAKRIDQNLEIIIQEGERLTRLINDVLDLAKIESGRIEWRDSVFPVIELLEQAIQSVHGEFASKPDVILKMGQVDPRILIHVDRDRILQVMINLLNNASKFTHTGHVSVDVSTHGTNEFSLPDGWIMIQVTDTGVGIPKEDLEKIFDKFKQVTKKDTLKDKPQGTGLGLSICRQIVSHYGGRIWAESKIDQGSTFSFILPQYKSEQNMELDQTPREGIHEGIVKEQSPLVLVVDDDFFVRHYISQLLEGEGIRVISTGDGQAALELAREKHPDLITMDLSMPGMDGNSVIRTLRSNPYLQHIPVIVISALPERYQAGGDASLTKPIRETDLIETIYSLVRKEKTQHTPCLVVNSEHKSENWYQPANCADSVIFCQHHEIKQYLEDGFYGRIIIPSDLSNQIDLDMLVSLKHVQVIIL
ncbi:MAG: AAA family ATPase [Desulfobacterales bacterium]|nr:AAA family ATPase [Desulfobacterales bacterium]